MTWGAVQAAALSFVLLACVFWPLERLWSARTGQPWLRPRWGTDLLFFLGQYLVWSTLALAVLSFVAEGLDGLGGAGAIAHVRGAFSAWPLPLRVVVVVVSADVAVYGFHRACHAWGPLWRIHSVHHSAEHLDWLAAHREHPIDGVLTQLVVNAPAMLLGLELSAIAWLVALRGLWAIFIHSNVRVPLGPLRMLLGAPDLHHWHHRRAEGAQNFANLAPWTDWLFGTYHRPSPLEEETWELGVTSPMPKGYLGLLLWPFRATAARAATAPGSPAPDSPPPARPPARPA